MRQVIMQKLIAQDCICCTTIVYDMIYADSLFHPAYILIQHTNLYFHDMLHRNYMFYRKGLVMNHV